MDVFMMLHRFSTFILVARALQSVLAQMQPEIMSSTHIMASFFGSDSVSEGFVPKSKVRRVVQPTRVLDWTARHCLKCEGKISNVNLNIAMSTTMYFRAGSDVAEFKNLPNRNCAHWHLRDNCR